jgi:sugar phosphate isomerase/epimerase
MSSDDSSPVPIDVRLAAVRDAGFKGFGIRHSDLLQVEQGIGFAAFRRMLDDHGLVHLELEFLEDWMFEGPERVVSDEHRADFLRASEALSPRHIKIGANLRGGDFVPERLAPHLIKLADDVANAGTRVALEPMPFADVRTPADGLQLIEMVDHPAAGLCLDIWHVERADVDPKTLVSIPGHRIFSVELDDAPREFTGSIIDDTFDGRLFPGEGDFDIPGFVEAVRATGYTGPWGVEMLSVDFRAMPVEEATVRAYSTSIAFLDFA